MLPGGQLLFVNSNLHRFNKLQISQAGILNRAPVRLILITS